MPRKRPTLRDVVARLEKLEDAMGVPILPLPHPRAIPGCPLLPEHDIDGTPIPWEQRVYHVIYPGKPKRPLRPGEYERLKAYFGNRLIEPFRCRIGDLVGHHRPHDDAVEDDEDDEGERE